MTVREDILLIICDHTENTDPPGCDEDLVEYGIDSLDTITLFVAIEEHFGIDIPEDQWDGLTTVNKIADLVEAALAPRIH